MIAPFNVMIDLETLDTRPTAAVVQIGAVVDDTRYNIISRLHVDVSVASNMSMGRTVSEGTVDWWRKTDPAMLDEFQTYTTPLDEAIQQLTDFIPPKARVWANAPTFDLAILRNIYDYLGWDAPWKYWQECCYRTIKIVHDRGLNLEQNGHRAVEDASMQMRNLKLLMARA